MSRWILHDPGTGETWTMPINPDSMTSPHPAKNFTNFAVGIGSGPNRTRSIMSHSMAVEWTWEGVIRSQAHYEALEDWEKRGEIHVTDHLGRTWDVVMQGFDPKDRMPTQGTPWRLRYSMTVLVLAQLG